MSEVDNAPTAKSPYQAYVAGFGSAIALTVGVLGFIQNFSNIRFVDVQSYFSMREVEDKYYLKSFVESHYLDKVVVVNDYIKKDELKEKLVGYVSLEKVNSDFVSKVSYEGLQLKYQELASRLDAIPSPLKLRRKMLSASGEWNDQQLGVSVSVKKHIIYSEGTYQAIVFLSLPDSPLHQEVLYSDALDRCKWTFRKDNRDFELKVEGFNPLIFAVREI